MGRLGSGRPARNHSQDLHRAWHMLCQFFRVRALYLRFTFALRRIYIRKGSVH